MATERKYISIGTLGGIWNAVTTAGEGRLAEGIGPEEAIAALVTADPSVFGLTVIETLPDEKIPSKTILVEQLETDWLVSVWARGRLNTRTSTVKEQAIGKILIEFASELNLEVRRKETKPTTRRRR